MIPLALQKNVFGLIEVYDGKERVFENNDILIAKLFSHHVSVALENARLLSEAQKRNDEQKTFYSS